MIYDLSQPLYNNSPQFPGQPPNSVVYFQHAQVKGATVERLELMTHSGSHIDAPFHFEPHLPSVSELPLSHFYGTCVAIDLRPLPPSHPINHADLRKQEALITPGTFVLLKTGWGDRRINSKSFLMEWPYMSGDGAQYLVDRGVKGMGIDALSVGGYGDEHAEADAHRILLSRQKLLLEDIHIPDELLDGVRRYFSALPILVANASGAWVRAIVWDQGDLERESPVPEKNTIIPPSVEAQIGLQREAQ